MNATPRRGTWLAREIIIASLLPREVNRVKLDTRATDSRRHLNVLTFVCRNVADADRIDSAGTSGVFNR